ncbi:MAG: triose-phosphate isomerase [Sphingomonadaceae bacterium]
MARTPIIAGNWKMNTTLREAVALVDAMRPRAEAIQGVETVVCPPFVSLAAVRDHLQGSSILVGAQNMHFMEKGAYTGEISPLMLRGLADYVIIGHSERRLYFRETDDLVAKKVKAALDHGLKPIMCVGERLEEYEAGLTEEVVTRQVKGGLAGLQSIEGLVIAYEPVWAIGTGKPATGAGANRVIGIIRRVVASLFGEDAAAQMRIQYGGSVTPDNIAEFMGQPEIDGGLVGGASLKADSFVEIVRLTAEAKA